MRILCANFLRFLEFYLVLLKIFSPLVSADFAISFLVANFTTCLQLLIKVLSLSFTLFCYLAKNPSFRLFFYLTDPLKHLIPFWLFRSESVLFRYNLLVAASFFPFSLLLCSALFAFLWFFFWCYKYRSRNNYSRNKNICAYCYTFLTFIIRNYFSPQPPSLFFPFCNLYSSHLRIYSVYFTREGGREAEGSY